MQQELGDRDFMRIEGTERPLQNSRVIVDKKKKNANQHNDVYILQT